MRHILIDLSSDNHLEQPQIFAGYAGEHNETILQVKLPKRMVDIECSGYRFDFQTSEDNKISSPLIPISKLNNDILSFNLTEQLTIGGKLLFNVTAILSDKNNVSLISKTNTVVLFIEDTPKGKEQLINPIAYKDELQKMIDERIPEIANVDQTYDPASKNAQSGTAVNEAIEQASIVFNFGNALKGDAAGEFVALKDVSSSPHSVKTRLANSDAVTVCGKNLLDRSLSPIAGLRNETSFSANITVAMSREGLVKWLKPNVTYTLSYDIECINAPQSPLIPETAVGLSMRSKPGVVIFNPPYSRFRIGDRIHCTQTFTLTEEQYSSDALEMLAYSNRGDNGTLGIIIIRNLQIEAGPTETEYEPFIEPTTYATDENGHLVIPSIHPSMTLFSEVNVKNLLTGVVLQRPDDWVVDNDVYSSSCGRYKELILEGAYLEAGREYTFSVNVLESTLNENDKPYHSYSACLKYVEYIDGKEIKHESIKLDLDVVGNLQQKFIPATSGTYNLVVYGRSLNRGSVSFTNPQLILSDQPIKCEYNRDINKAFAELQQAIISLGGNI